MRVRKVFVRGVSTILGLAFSLPAAVDSAEQAAQKILARNCYGCHGEARMSGLDLREISSILKGGKRGPAVVPGHSAESLLYKAISGTGDLKMPPGKATVTADEVRAIAAWIDGGAKWPDSSRGSATESTWWAFRKP